MSPKSLLSIATGAGFGVLGAVFLQMDPAEPAPARAAADKPRDTAPSEPIAVEAKPSPAPVQVVNASTQAAPAKPAEPAGPKTAAEVTRAEMACDARDKAGCLRAAEAYEAGVAVPQNLALARSYRKRELTLVVRSCEARSPSGCLELSRRYARGEGVEQNDKTAEALVAHARELCTLKRSHDCDAL